MKKIMLGTSDPWSTSHSSQRTSVLYCRLSDFRLVGLQCFQTRQTLLANQSTYEHCAALERAPALNKRAR